MVRYSWIDEDITYDGTQLSSLFAYKTAGIQGDSIVSFQGPCRVELDKMVDAEDVLNNAPISGLQMLHFIAEHFRHDMLLTVTRQRLLVMLIREILSKDYGKAVVRAGDDLYYGEGKLSVSIATLSPVSGVIHTALNVTNEGTPVHTASLTELGIANVQEFAQQVMRQYAEEISAIDMAACKVRGVL